MIGKLDEECIRPGDVTQFTLMEKFNESFGSHAHYQSRGTNKTDKTLGDDVFRLRHYAGDVHKYFFSLYLFPFRPPLFFPESHKLKLNIHSSQVIYNVEFFIDKNKDLLFKDLMYCMNSSQSEVVR